MAERYIAPSSIGPATDSRKPNAFEKIQMWWNDGSSKKNNTFGGGTAFGGDGSVFRPSSYTDDDYLSDMQKASAKAIEDVNKAQAKKDKDNRDRAIQLYNEDRKQKTQQMNMLISKPNKTPEDIETLKDLNAYVATDFNNIDQTRRNGFLEAAKTQSVNPTIAPQPGVPAPIRATEQPGATPTPGQQANGGGGSFVPPPEKNKPNQYTFADGHKEYDSTAIPDVLQKGKITPARYFAMNGMNFIRDAKNLAKEMGMTNYRGTPGENYALVNYMEEKKNGNPTAGGENRGSNRKFDGIQSDVLPNRFTQEERDKVTAMTPEEQAKYVSERNVADLKKMLPGNVGLINKVFGTNYTSDDLTGGIGRATIMGTGMTAKGMEIQKLIEGLNEATANKFMNKGAELDNAIIDDTRMNTGSVQSGRRKILEDMVDGRTPMGQGTTLDAQDQEYMQAYKDYKRVKAVSDKYNQKIGQYNSMDPNNVARNKVLVDIQGFVNDLKDKDPQSFQALQGDLDKIPEFISKGGTGKIPTATVAHPAEAKQSTTAPVNSVNPKIKIAPANNQNIVDSNKPAPIDPNKPQPKVYGDYVPTNPNMETIDDKTPLPISKTPTPLGTQKNSGGYTRDDGESRVGYSSNLMSQG